MTIEQYRHYHDISWKLFAYMNGIINKRVIACLQIDMYDYVNNTYANIRYPNNIFLHIGTIIDSYDKSWSHIMDEDSYIVTCIAWALSHELHHVEQIISMVTYGINPEYKKRVEEDVERASYDWVAYYARDLEYVTGSKIVITDLDSPSLPESGNYKKISIDGYYKQTIANTILRDLELYKKLTILTDDDLVDNIVLSFNDTDSVVIKSNKRYLEDSMDWFAEIVYKYAGYFDKYNINTSVTIKEENGKKTAYLNFTITNSLINPMIFKPVS